MHRTITELSEDYFKAAEDIDCLIKKCNREIKEAVSNGDMKKYYYLKHKRLVFYSQKHDATLTAHMLKNYYRREDDSLESA